MNNHLPTQEQTSVDGDQIGPSERIKKRKKKIGMAIAKHNYNRKHHPNQGIQIPQARCPQPLSYQRPQNSQKLNQGALGDKYLSQSQIFKQWEVEMERLNTKYNLDCLSESELDSESNELEQYRYEHGYETLI